MSKVLDKYDATCEAGKRGYLNRLILKLTQSQKDLLELAYPDGIGEEKLEEAVNLIERTLRGREE